MSDAAPDQQPETQPQCSGGPPGPPKITARDLEDGSPKNPDSLMNLVKASNKASELLELLESIRGTRLHALNLLEAQLDVYVVRMSKLRNDADSKLRQALLIQLKAIRDYRARHPRLRTGDPDVRELAQKVLDALGPSEVEPSGHTQRRSRGLFAFLASLVRRE